MAVLMTGGFMMGLSQGNLTLICVVYSLRLALVGFQVVLVFVKSETKDDSTRKVSLNKGQ